MPRRKGSADAPQHTDAHRQHNQRADGSHRVGGQIKCKAEAHRAEHQQKIRKPAGHGRAQHIAQKAPAHQLSVRLQRQNKGRYTDGYRRHQRKLQRLEGIRQRQAERHHAEQQREDVFDQKQRGRALDIVDDTATLAHNGGQSAEIRIQQNQLRHLRGCLCAAGHGNAAIGIF